MFEDFYQSDFNKEAERMPDYSGIKVIPHWRIIIRPQTYNENCILSIKTYYKKFEIKEKQHPKDLAGWHYPAVDLNKYNLDPFSDPKEFSPYIESKSYHENDVIKEYWRFHRSGQFIHLHHIDTQPYIGIHAIIHSISKIFAFAAYLGRCSKDHADVVIQIVNLNNVRLNLNGNLNGKFSGDIGSYPANTNHLCLDPVKIDKSVLNSSNDTEINKLARDAINLILQEYFGPKIKKAHIFREEYFEEVQRDLKESKIIPY